MRWLTDYVDWGGKLSQTELLAEAKRLRLAHWKIQKDAGVDVIPSNDFALYDQVLCHIQDFGVSDLPLQWRIDCNLMADPGRLSGRSRAVHQGWP